MVVASDHTFQHQVEETVMNERLAWSGHGGDLLCVRDVSPQSLSPFVMVGWVLRYPLFLLCFWLLAFMTYLISDLLILLLFLVGIGHWVEVKGLADGRSDVVLLISRGGFVGMNRNGIE